MVLSSIAFFFFLGTLRHYRSLLGLDLSQGSVLFFQL
jgi:hypothetical protein